ncbi:hypothetical protein FBQ82_21255 [Anaerolineae bacterium CFX7]|nr:hypothetical protein [Anaerolineae bacterium CFX7]
MMSKFYFILFGCALLSGGLLGCANPNAPSPDSFARPAVTLERPTVRASLLDGSSAAPPALTGKFIFAPGDGSIWLQDAATGKAQPVIKPTPELLADAPSFAPDGNSFVYIRSSLNAQGNAQNALYRARLDGSQNEPVLIPPDDKTAYNWPHYSWDGKWIYFTASYPVPPNQQASSIQRIPATGGQPQTIIENARMSTEAPDGKTIVFVRFNTADFTAGLWSAKLDGSDARELLSDQVFVMLSSPQYAPDGSQILFTASGPNTRPLPGLQSWNAPACAPQLLCLFAPPAYADGLPWDLWSVTPDGKKFTRLTQVGADSPWPAWSRDSKQIAFFDTSGQYLVDLTTHALTQISKNGGHGVFGWWQPEP